MLFNSITCILYDHPQAISTLMNNFVFYVKTKFQQVCYILASIFMIFNIIKNRENLYFYCILYNILHIDIYVTTRTTSIAARIQRFILNQEHSLACMSYCNFLRIRSMKTRIYAPNLHTLDTSTSNFSSARRQYLWSPDDVYEYIHILIRKAKIYFVESKKTTTVRLYESFHAILHAIIRLLMIACNIAWNDSYSLTVVVFLLSTKDISAPAKHCWALSSENYTCYIYIYIYIYIIYMLYSKYTLTRYKTTIHY